MSRRNSWFIRLFSFHSLILAGFIFVAAPLVAAVITSAIYIDKLVNQSQEAVTRAVKSTQLSRILVEQATAMERNARQYFVLGNASLLKSYTDRHESYLKVSSELKAVTHDSVLLGNLNTLSTLEMTLYERMLAKVQAKEPTTLSTHDYITMTEIAKSLLNDSDHAINTELNIMNNLSSKAEDTVFWELMMLMPTSVIFIVVFTNMLTKIMRQMQYGIEKIGEGNFDNEIQIKGPHDVVVLGERLDWLRLRLKYLEDKKVKFLQYVSHELKTPLTAIREGADLMADGVAGSISERQREVCSILKNNSMSLQRMIEKLLNYNMPGEGNLAGEYSKIRTKKVIENVLADHKPVILAKNIKMRVFCEDWTFNTDEEQFRVIVDNLLSNAVKYTPDDGTIYINLKQKDSQIWLDVKDSGPGVNYEDQEKIFDAFFQSTPPEKGVVKGSGLGLSIVKEFVESQRGRIQVINDSTIGGAHFRITWPMGIDNKEGAWAAQ